MKLLSDDNRELALSAIELFGKGVTLWRGYIRDLDQVIQRIFRKTQSSKDDSQLNLVAQHSLLLVGNAEPQQMILSLRKNIVFTEAAPLEAIAKCSPALIILGNLIRQVAFSFHFEVSDCFKFFTTESLCLLSLFAPSC